MIYLTLYNNLWIKIDTEDITSLNLIKEHFSYRPEGYQFSKLYKSGAWNGYIQLFDYRNRMLPYGLLFDLIKLLKNNNYDIQASDEVKNIYKNYSYDSISFNYDLKYYPRYYQDEIIKSCIKHKCGVFSSATASGKSLSLAYIVKILKENNLINRSLIVVPTTSLIIQFYDDLIEYGIDENLLGKFYADSKDWDKPILISTWQSLSHDPEKIRQNELKEIHKELRKKSLSDENKEYYTNRKEIITSSEYLDRIKKLKSYKNKLLKSIDCVIIDEVQSATSRSVSDLLKQIPNAEYRFGCTGTLPDEKLDVQNIKSFIGPILKKYTVEELTNAGYLNKCDIQMYHLYYNTPMKGTLNEVKDQLFESEFRYDVIKDIVNNIGDENVLILVGRIEKEGKLLENYLNQQFPDKKVKFVYGGTKTDQREEWRQKCIDENNIILLASYPVFQAGINIPNLRYVIFASSYKSMVRIGQSIGRSLRTKEGKEDSCIIDLVDHSNKYIPKQSKERLKYYNKEGFDIQEFVYKEKEYVYC